MGTTTFLVHAALLFMYDPSSWFCNASFPFHATTTQMLHGRSKSKSSNDNGPSGFENVRLRRAADLARRIRQGVATLQSYAIDLLSFLEEIDPADDELEYVDEDLVTEDRNRAAQSGNKPNNHKKRNVVPPPSGAFEENPKPKPLEHAEP